jgi:hypothetical protein
MPRENPSATRASGALPVVYLLSAFPLVLIATGIPKAFSNKKLPWVSLGLIVLVWAGSYTANTDTYFNEYRARYNTSTWPYSEPGEVMRDFVTDGGDYGNAFLVYYGSWWDYTIVGMEAGIMDWPNGIAPDIIPVPDFLRDAYYCAGRDYPVDPDKGLLFFYREDDPNAEANLKEWFPGGYSTFMQGIKAQYNFMIYRVPALGVVGWEVFIAEYAEVPTCQRG